MDFEFCNKREKLVMFERDGTKSEVRRCAEPSSVLFQQNVTPQLCEGCPVRQGVNKKASEKKPKPLKVKELYQIAKVEKHKPKPKEVHEWLPCKHRQTAYIKICCGDLVQIPQCNMETSPYNGTEVVPSICHGCQHREE